ncbi:tRNA (adenosine(37)-N6)-dimethylallyltransferase MiaA [Comamonas sp. MYb21]|uniref:tRNA (adenosine(37)-N6)-dimethylallyltransferase MiaA n=1 Tax=Comamonas sp. MYb21 TaxID=1848648 RepID=UPI00403F1354
MPAWGPAWPAHRFFTVPSAASSPLCLGLAGPTASGKTGAAIALAQQLGAARPVEIISVDSALIYRGMDIGSAKPSVQEQAGIPHHLLDIRDPLDAYSAAEFVRDALALVAQIHARGGISLLVGGTMLYFKALMDGIDDMPAADPAVRAQLDAEAALHGWPHMHGLLAQVDPVTAQRLAPGDSQRVQRALEVWRISGQPLSHFHAQQKRPSPLLQLAPSFQLFSLEPSDRAWLHARIALRYDQMLAQGFLAEVQQLRARGDLQLNLPSMRCVGYRQMWEMLDRCAQQGIAVQTESDVPPALWAEMREQGIAATRQLAKRQITWLRSMPARQAIACDAPGALDQWLRAASARLAAAGT